MFIEVISRLMAGPNLCIAETLARKMLRFDQGRNFRILQMIVQQRYRIHCPIYSVIDFGINSEIAHQFLADSSINFFQFQFSKKLTALNLIVNESDAELVRLPFI